MKPTRLTLCTALILAAGLLLSPVARSQTGASIVGFWTRVSGTVTHEHAFTRDSRYESKLYGSIVYQVSCGTYVVSGDQLTLYNEAKAGS